MALKLTLKGNCFRDKSNRLFTRISNSQGYISIVSNSKNLVTQTSNKMMSKLWSNSMVGNYTAMKSNRHERLFTRYQEKKSQFSYNFITFSLKYTHTYTHL